MYLQQKRYRSEIYHIISTSCNNTSFIIFFGLRRPFSPLSEINIFVLSLFIYHVSTSIKIDRYQMIEDKYVYGIDMDLHLGLRSLKEYKNVR